MGDTLGPSQYNDRESWAEIRAMRNVQTTDHELCPNRERHPRRDPSRECLRDDPKQELLPPNRDRCRDQSRVQFRMKGPGQSLDRPRRPAPKHVRNPDRSHAPSRGQNPVPLRREPRRVQHRKLVLLLSTNRALRRLQKHVQPRSARLDQRRSTKCVLLPRSERRVRFRQSGRNLGLPLRRAQLRSTSRGQRLPLARRSPNLMKSRTNSNPPEFVFQL